MTGKTRYIAPPSVLYSMFGSFPKPHNSNSRGKTKGLDFYCCNMTPVANYDGSTLEMYIVKLAWTR